MEQSFEKLGTFYLGRVEDLESSETTSEDLLYDAKDLTTHALCVGMTGSGKTGLCLSLLEEAGIDGIPAIVVDPKGDIGNLLLTFPQLRAQDFRPWIDESAAARKEQTPEQLAEQTAETWRQGLAKWGQDGTRIERFRNAVDMAIYTPGSSAGLPLTVLKSFTAPAAAIVEDIDAFRDRVASAAAGLLALLGIDIDPVRSREFILVSSILDHAWRAGRDVDIESLIHEIQAPPFEQIGVMSVDSFYPKKDRMELSMTLNSLLASPSFAGWLEGEPLDIKRLLYTPDGKPRISILSIAHLSESERMFFVTILLNELLAWVRTQPGTPSLRALFYMDEVFGYFPPVANPPSKKPMLTLLKQARAFGLGLVLATQNPVDLDYKGLSNCGTWFLGRLQTQRDKARVLDGLQGATSQAGAAFDRRQMNRILSDLDSRVFLMNNVHDDGPVVFHTRWVMSYLRGPLTRDQIHRLMAERKSVAEKTTGQSDLPEETLAEVEPEVADVPAEAPEGTLDQQLPPDVPQRYLAVRRTQPDDTRVLYRPALLGTGELHFVRVMYHVDHVEPRTLVRPAQDARSGGDLSGGDLSGKVWDNAKLLARPWPLEDAAQHDVPQALLPKELTSAKKFELWRRQLVDVLYRTQRLEVFKCAALKTYSKPGEAEDDFRIRLVHRLHEERDEQVDKMRERFAAKTRSLDQRIQRAQDRVGRAKSEYRQETVDTAISIGKSIFGALFSRKKLSRANVDRASSSARKASRVAKEKEDVRRAENELDQLLQKRVKLDDQIARDVAKIEAKYQPEGLEIETLTIRPIKKDITVDPVMVVWRPWFIDGNDTATRAF